MKLFTDDLLGEVGEILEGLFGVEKSHVLKSIGIVAEG